jgi:hypothetical protein
VGDAGNVEVDVDAVQQGAADPFLGIVPHNHRRSLLLFASTSPSEITASMTMSGAAGEVFVRQIFVPSPRPGQIILWYTWCTLGVHKNLETRRLVEAGVKAHWGYESVEVVR